MTILYRYATRISPRSHIIGILSLALVVRLAAMVFVPVPIYTTDGYDDNRYDALAWNIAQGKGYIDSFGHPETKDPPLLPLIAGILYKLFGHDRQYVFLLQIMVSVAMVGMLYLLGKLLFRPVVGLLAAGLAAIYPDFILYADIFLTETFFIFFLCVAMVCWVCALQKESIFWWAATGSMLALTALCRPTAQFLIVPILGVPLLFRLTPTRRQLAQGMVACGGGFALFLAPWAIRNYAMFGQFLLIATGSGIALWVGTNIAWSGYDVKDGVSIYSDPDFVRVSTGNPFIADRRMIQESFRHVVDNPLGWVKILPKKFVQMNKGPSAIGFYYPYGHSPIFLLLGFALFYACILFFACVGLWVGLRARTHACVLVLVPILYIALITVLTIPAQRYMLPTMPFFMLLAAFGIVAVGRAIRRVIRPATKAHSSA